MAPHTHRHYHPAAAFSIPHPETLGDLTFYPSRVQSSVAVICENNFNVFPFFLFYFTATKQHVFNNNSPEGP